MDEHLRRQVRERAAERCEYCRTPQTASLLPFQVDHIIAQVHHGLTELQNLAWSCFDCNVYKGTNLAGFNQEANQIVRLYHPRNDRWQQHFEWEGPLLRGKSPEGRATIDVLRINLPSRIEHRRLLQLIDRLVLEG